MTSRLIKSFVLAPIILGAFVALVHMALVLRLGVPIVGLTPQLQGDSPGGRSVFLGASKKLVSGAFHVHTTASDGKGELDHVAEAAARAGLEFLVLADHNVDPPEAHYRKGVLIVPGIELSTSAGHIVSVGGTRSASWTLRQKDPVGAVRYSGGMAVLAHPVNLMLPWSGSFDDVDGMELVSGDSLFREALEKPFSVLTPAILAAPVSTTLGWLFLHNRSDEAFRKWDENPHLVGLCSHDAHGYEGYYGPFRAMQLMVNLPEPLPEDAAEAVDLLLLALMDGKVMCSLGALADPRGFSLEIDRLNSIISASLSYVDWPSNVRSRTVLIRDGQVAAQGSKRAEGEYDASSVYRAEVYLEVPWVVGRREFLWIFTSNVKKEG